METKPPPRPSDQQLLTLQRQLKRNLFNGLTRAGARPYRRGRWILLRQEPPVRFYLDSYAVDLRWWRATYDFGPHGSIYRPMRDYGELTFHRDEVDEQAGVDLARFLREFPRWRWPIFVHGSLRNVWTALADETYEEDLSLREARQKRIAERRVGR